MRAVVALAGSLACIALHPAVSADVCSNTRPVYVTDQFIRQIPQVTEPPARTPFRDPLFDSCMVRVTDRDHDKDADDPSGGASKASTRSALGRYRSQRPRLRKRSAPDAPRCPLEGADGSPRIARLFLFIASPLNSRVRLRWRSDQSRSLRRALTMQHSEHSRARPTNAPFRTE